MNLVEIFLLGVALSLDTFAVSLTLGFVSGKTTHSQKVRYLGVIGLFHFLMITAGWFVGENVSRLITRYDHWVAFILLAFIGANMIREGLQSPKKEENQEFQLLSFKNTMLFGLALSIDALISGFTLGMVKIDIAHASQFVNMLITATIVGFCAASISASAIMIGKKSSSCLGAKAEIFGGIILILMGVKILIEHLFFS